MSDSDLDCAPHEIRQELNEMRRKSAFYFWLHPKKARRSIDDLANTIDDLRNRLEQSQREQTRLKEDNNHLTQRLRISKEQAERDNNRNLSEIAKLERNSDSLQREIEEWRHTQTELEALASTVDEWAEMKRNYEKQIKELNIRLNDALGNFRGSQTAPKKIDVSDILDDTDSPYAEPQPRRPQRHRPQGPPPDETDWLLPLPGE